MLGFKSWKTVGERSLTLTNVSESWYVLVTFIDERGKALLAEMHQHGAELVAEGCMNTAIVEEIIQGERR